MGKKGAGTKPLHPYNVEVGQRLAAAREANEMKSVQLAGKLGVSQSRLSNWETGDAVFPPRYAAAAMRLLKIDPNYLYLGDLHGLPGWLQDKLLADEREADSA